MDNDRGKLIIYNAEKHGELAIITCYYCGDQILTPQSIIPVGWKQQTKFDTYDYIDYWFCPNCKGF